MRRREFLGVLGGAVVACPMAVRALQSSRMRRIGLLLPFSANNSELQADLAVFKKGLDASAEQIRIVR
jgi:hypothetical protein